MIEHKDNMEYYKEISQNPRFWWVWQYDPETFKGRMIYHYDWDGSGVDDTARPFNPVSYRKSLPEGRQLVTIEQSTVFLEMI